MMRAALCPDNPLPRATAQAGIPALRGCTCGVADKLHKRHSYKKLLVW